MQPAAAATQHKQRQGNVQLGNMNVVRGDGGVSIHNRVAKGEHAPASTGMGWLGLRMVLKGQSAGVYFGE